MRVTRLIVKGCEHLDGVPYVGTGSGSTPGSICLNNGTVIKVPVWQEVTRPSAAMTAASSRNCVASASTEYHSSYTPYLAFNKDSSTAYGWASKASDKSPWQQQKMDVPLKNIEVTFTNRTRSSEVNGPISGTVLGSDDGSSWVELCSFDGFNGSTSGAVAGKVICGNYDYAYQYIRVSFTKWGGSSYIAVGEMSITGKMAT